MQVEKEPKRYGQRTVGIMIQQALAQAGLSRIAGASKSTKDFEALVDKKVMGASRRLKWIVAILSAALVVGGAGLGYYVYRNRTVWVYQTTQINYGDAAGGTVAAANRYAVFMVAGVPKAEQGGALQGFCTAFAVTPDTLATNAHCIFTAIQKFTGISVLMNGAMPTPYPVLKMVAHPGYREGFISPDVGLLRIKGRLANLVQVATQDDLSHVAPGVPVFLYGFPGRLNKAEAPEATFVNGDIGRVTAFDQRLGQFGENTLLQHSAFSSTGTSGSPIFNSSGRVIGINAGGYSEGGAALSGYNFGMRIDLLSQLFPLLDNR